MNNKSRRTAKGLTAVALTTASLGAYAVNDLGQAVQNIGGNQLLVNAGNAIYTTCIGFATNIGPTGAAQTELSQRCVDMTQTGFALGNIQDAPVPAEDTFGFLNQGAQGNQAYLNLLRQFTGEEVSSQGRYASEGSISQFKSLAGRLGAIRRGSRRSGLAFNMQGVDVISVADDADSDSVDSLYGAAAGEGDSDSGWAWFANVEYGFGDRDDSPFENGYDADSFGMVLGVDYAFNDSWVAGAALNLQWADIEFDDESSAGVASVSGGDLEAESESLSLFVNYATGMTYASLIVTFGSNEYDMTRNAVIPIATTGGLIGGLPATVTTNRSSTDGDQFSTQLQVGHTFGEGATTWDVYGGFELSNLEIDSFNESGSLLALQFGDQEIDSQQGLLGLSVRRAMSTESGVFVPYASAEYRHEFDNDSRVVSARYVLSTSQNFTFQGESDNFLIPTADPDEGYFDVTVGVSAQFGNSIAAFAQFNSLLGLEDTSANMITVGIRGSF